MSEVNLNGVSPGTNPQDMIESAEGKYDDAASRMTDEQRFPMLPKGPDPKPHGPLQSPSGPGRDGV